MALLWTRSKTSMSFLCWGTQSWMQYSGWGSHNSGVKGQNHLPRPAGHTSLDAAQDTVGFLGCKHTLPAHIELLIRQYPQVLPLRAAMVFSLIVVAEWLGAMELVAYSVKDIPWEQSYALLGSGSFVDINTCTWNHRMGEVGWDLWRLDFCKHFEVFFFYERQHQ